MDILQYGLEAYNLLLGLVGLILGAFLGPLRSIALVLLVLAGVCSLGGLLLWRRRPRP